MGVARGVERKTRNVKCGVCSVAVSRVEGVNCELWAVERGV